MSAPGTAATEDLDAAADSTVQPAAPEVVPEVVAPKGFQVKLVNFNGPFDLLLQLIGKQKLEITELALSMVTDEFIAYIRAMGDNWDLGEVSEFLVVAATLLDLKAAKLLPQAEVEDDEDLALLEARDLLFARLLQYKAFKEAASVISALDAEFSRGYPRIVKLEQQYAEALPDLVLGIGAERLAQLAVKAMGPKPVPTVGIGHVHMVRVNVREHLAIITAKLLELRTATFRALCADCQSTLEVVARFLALLELYREGLVSFEQPLALGELVVTWIGADTALPTIEVDEYGDESDAPDGSADGADGPDAATDRPAATPTAPTAPAAPVVVEPFVEDEEEEEARPRKKRRFVRQRTEEPLPGDPAAAGQPSEVDGAGDPDTGGDGPPGPSGTVQAIVDEYHDGNEDS